MAGQSWSCLRVRESFMCLYLRSVLLWAGFSLCWMLALLMIDPSAAAQGLVGSDLSRLRSVGSVELSPYGRRIAYGVVTRDRPGRPYGQLWIMDLATQRCVRVGSEKDSGGGPLWSPDGKCIVFDGPPRAQAELYAARADGSEGALPAAASGSNKLRPGPDQR